MSLTFFQLQNKVLKQPSFKEWGLYDLKQLESSQLIFFNVQQMQWHRRAKEEKDTFKPKNVNVRDMWELWWQQHLTVDIIVYEYTDTAQPANPSVLCARQFL